MIKVEIILRLLLSVLLLFIPLFLIVKHKKSFFKNIIEGIKESADELWGDTIWTTSREKKLQKVKEKAKSLSTSNKTEESLNGQVLSKELSPDNRWTDTHHRDIFDKIDEELLWTKKETRPSPIPNEKTEKKNNSTKKVHTSGSLHSSIKTQKNEEKNMIHWWVQAKKSGTIDDKELTAWENWEKANETPSPYKTWDEDLSPIQKQRAKEKEQQKLKEIRIAALTNKERGKFDDYEKKLIEGLALDPDNKEFLERLSDYYFVNWNHIKAMTLLKRLVNQSPEDHKAIRQIWQIYVTQEDFDTARILIEKAISVKGDNPKYHITLVDIHYTQNNLKKAIRAMEKVLKLRPTSINYLLSIATLHEEASEPTRAFWYYSKIIELDPMHELAKDWLKRLW